ncbi:LysR family transcriptional regulator [Burkholderia plantarii]|uniref:Transcriptional regulator, LysR family n=1 Tax=Burkholderia plantarii TaxID=41899 RepID=A0A0B6S2I8_BURPL|nr:LysR family transcriptional regulator [Burkholderia plantarii]AJK46436.1 transcriptional regulator, LysR family [Burkholderia plantarii]
MDLNSCLFDLRIEALFVRVVESGSFSAAAKEAGIGQSAASKQVALLEAWLGAQLLNRSSRTLSLTEAGRVFHESGLRMLDELAGLETQLSRGRTEPSGLLRVAVAPLFGSLYVVPHLPVFFERFPNVRVELVASERHINLIEENIDLAIRHGDLPDSSMTMQGLAESRLATMASPAYLARRGEPRQPAELAGHACLVFTGGGEAHAWTFRKAKGSPLVHRPDGPFRANDGEQLRVALLAHLGIAQVRPGWWHASWRRARCALYPARRRRNARLDVFVAHLAQTLALDLPRAGEP